MYAAVLVLWAAWSGGWLAPDVAMAASAVGTGWLAIAAFGAVVGVALGLTRVSDEYRLFKTQSNRERIRRFRDHVFGGGFLGLYVVALAAWSLLTVKWVVLNLGIVGRSIVAYGWFLIALYGPRARRRADAETQRRGRRGGRRRHPLGGRPRRLVIALGAA